MADEGKGSGGTPEPLAAEALYRRCGADALDFETTDDLDDLREIVGQARASEAVRFGIRMGSDGFNIYALGPEETDKRTLVRHFVDEQAADEEPPGDLCYVNNFDERYKPRVLRLPAGVGCELSSDMEALLEELDPALTAAFESEEYQTRRQAIQEEAGEEQQAAFEALQEKARERDLRLLRTPAGFAFAPVKDGEVIPPDELDRLSDEEREEMEAAIEGLQEELQQILRGVPRRQREVREKIRELDREVARFTVRDLLGGLRERYEDFDAVLAHLDAVEEDIVQNVQELVGQNEEEQMAALLGRSQQMGGGRGEGSRFRRYRVNVLVDHSESEHAPVVYEDNPTYQNLVGRVEHLPMMGALITDFNLIKAGALHRANGGYLILDAQRVLTQPFAWEGLKRALQSGQLRIESPREALGLVSTVSLDPEPVDLDVKVVLLGSRLLYYLLAHYDPDFGDLFKVEADFEERLDRTPENEALYARLVASLVRKEELRPFDRSAVCRVVERSGRMVDDAEKLSVRTRTLIDLIREADFWAGEEDAGAVTADHVRKAVDQREYRASRIRDRMREEILRDTIYIDTDGEKVGQINGLSVIQLGDHAFGRPNRITARVRVGKGEVVDIEREVELGGPIHSKGVLILSSFLGARYATEEPLSMSASLVFEQSYGGIEGDSASSAELYALLSAVGGVPLRQSVAVTGSVNQHGEIQPIGGVNEKIEGFFDICSERGLTGEQGVLIPASNAKHLMLRDDVVEAVADGSFHVWPVEHVDEGMALLSDREMGEPDADGEYPDGTVNRDVQTRLRTLAERRRDFAEAGAGAGDEGEG